MQLSLVTIGRGYNMSTISPNNTQYNNVYKCSNCSSSSVQYKARENATLMKRIYPYLCHPCWFKMKRDSRNEFYEYIHSF